MMDRRMKQSLDRYITGNYGEDQFRDDELIVETTSFGTAYLEFNHYINMRLAIMLMDEEGMRIATLTVNMPEHKLEPGEFFVKTWSENQEIAADCLKSGLFEDTGKRVITGWVEAQVWRMTL